MNGSFCYNREVAAVYGEASGEDNGLGKLGANVYQMPEGDWAASANGLISDEFSSREDAIDWILRNLY